MILILVSLIQYQDHWLGWYVYTSVFLEGISSVNCLHLLDLTRSEQLRK